MLDDYLKVRGVGDLVAAGSALVLITMIVHYWGYVIFARIDVIGFFAIQDYMRLAALWVPIIFLLYGIGLVMVRILDWAENKYPKFQGILILSILIIAYMLITYFGYRKYLSEDPYLSESTAIVVSVVAVIYVIVISGTGIHFLNNHSIKRGAILLLVSVFITPAEIILSRLIYIRTYDVLFLTFLFSTSVLMYAYESNFILRVEGRDDGGLVAAVVAATIVFTFGVGAHQSQARLYTETPSVAVHVNYNDEPIEGTILINLSNTLLLSEPGSRDYIAISQREIRSIERLGD